MTMEFSPEVLRFARIMQEQIDANQESRGDGWLDKDVFAMLDHLKTEVQELETAIRSGFPLEMIEEEGADIGAMAMFIVARIAWGKGKPVEITYEELTLEEEPAV